MAYGYIGAEPTNDKSSNNGVFDITELNKLRTNENLSSEGFDVDFLLQAGGGGAINGLGTGGGGAGYLVTSSGNNGGGSTAEPSFRAYVGKAYDVYIGGGGGSYGIGGTTRFANIFAIGGGSGATQNSASYPGGGAGRFSGTGTRDTTFANLFGDTTDEYYEQFGHNTVGNYIGGSGAYNEGRAGGGGTGGVGSSGGGTGGAGTINNNFLSSSEATTESVGEVVSSNVYFGGGGSGGDYYESTTPSGGNGGGGSNSQNGTARTGGGGGGSRNNSGASSGGSGVAILKYPDSYTITDSTGLTLGTTYTAGGFSVTPIKAGDGSITWGRA